MYLVTKKKHIRLEHMNRTLYWYCILCIVSASAFAQQSTTTISGQILDKETNEPIVYASIYIKDLAIGTTSNEEGYFTFYVPKRQEDASIIVSMIGYESIEKKVRTFSDHQKIILSSKVNSLDEVVITSTKKKALTAKDIIKKAYKSIKNNYPNQPYILEGFVRDLQNEDDQYVEYLEFAAKLYYKGYTKQIEPSVELVEVRTSQIAEKHPWNANEERKNSIMDLIEDDFIRFDYGPIRAKKGWNYEIESILPYNKRYVYKIIGIDKPFQKAILYIDTETFAFVRMELTRSAINNRSWRRKFTNGSLQVYYNVIFEYQEYKGKMYLKYQKEEDTWKIFKGLESQKLLFIKKPKKELFINKIITDNVAQYPFTRNMKISTSIENQARPYNQEFWSTYNAPQQTEKESKIIEELKKIN